MSHDYSAIKNKHPKVYFKQYLHNSGEPLDNIFGDMPQELEAELLEDSNAIKRRFRRLAQTMRKN